MPVTVEWSTVSNFASTTSLINHGNSPNGSNTTPVEIFIRHNGANPITSCSFYTQTYTGSYTGSANAAADFTEVATTWGANNTANGFGGFQVNMNKSGGYTSTYTAMTHTNKTVLDGGSLVLGFTARTNDGSAAVAVDIASAVTLHVNMGLSLAGQIQTGTTPGVGFQARIKVPTDEDTAGIRQFDQVLRYTYTS